ncbi:MAG: prepilin-type N-terminal cleavage/methylation domain-containing protein, partial [Verrucomicrobiota bacterium]
MKNYRNGFTLIEVLVAMGVLMLLMLLFTRVINQTSVTTQTVEIQIEVATAARSALERLSVDLQNMVTQEGSTLVVIKDFPQKSGGGLNDSLLFLTQENKMQGEGNEMGARFGLRAYQIKPMDIEKKGSFSELMLALGSGSVQWSASSASGA